MTPTARSRWRRCSPSWSRRSRSVRAWRSSGSLRTCCPSPPRIGYMNGLALTILVGQLPKLFGFSIEANGLIDEMRKFVSGLASGDAVAAAAAVGVVSLALILLFQRWLAPHPRRAGRGRRRDRRDLGARSLRPRGFARRDPARGAAVPHLAEPGVRPPPPGCGSSRHRAGVSDRHDLHRFGVRGANAAGDRRQQGDDRHRRGECRGRLVPGLPGQHERLAHGRGRAGRREDPAHRAGRGRGDRPDAGARAGAAAATSRRPLSQPS